MRRLSLLICGLLLLTACRQAPAPLPPEEPVGVFPVEGYRPQPRDLDAVPYTCQGQGRQFSALCTVRTLTAQERELELQLKENALDQLVQLREAQPQQREQYDLLIHLLEAQLEALSAAPALYTTELRGTPLDDAIPAGTAVNWSLLREGQVLLSSTALVGTEPWLSLLNTADGSYSEGLLLPDLPAFDLELRWGDQTESLLLERQS